MVKQVNVFAENKPGRLDKITGILMEEKINMRSITIASSGGYGIVKLLVNDPEKAIDALKKGGVTASVKEVVAVEMSDRPGGLHTLLGFLLMEGVNIEDAYGFVIESGKTAVLVIEVDDPQAVGKKLEANKFNLVGSARLYNL